MAGSDYSAAGARQCLRALLLSTVCFAAVPALAQSRADLPPDQPGAGPANPAGPIEPGTAAASQPAPNGAPVAPVASITNAPQTTNDSEIVVTALKRATNIQQTPIAITAASADTLNKQNITDSQALGRISPSLVINEAANGGSRVIIRNLFASGEPLVGVYYDEVPLSGTGGVSNDAGATIPGLRLFDIERAEVLRGPQGTLYGASAMGGTIRIIFAKPKMDTYEGAVQGQVNSFYEGSGIGGQVNAVVNVPIIEGKVAARVVGFYDRSNGYIDNPLIGLKDFNGNKSYGGRATVRVKPIDDLTVDLLAVYQDRTGTGTAFNKSIYDLTGQKFKQPIFLQTPQRDRLKLFGATGNWDLGFATLTAVGSYSDRLLTYEFDYTPFFAQYETNGGPTRGLVSQIRSGTAITGYAGFLPDCSSGFIKGVTCDGAGYQNYVNGLGIQTTYQPQSNKTSTEELRLADDRHKLKWTVGVYHSFRKNSTESILRPTDPVTGLQISPGNQNGTSYTAGQYNIGLDRTIYDRLEQIAGFAELTYDVNSKLSGTAGIRYFDYKKATTTTVLIPSYISGSARQAPLTTRSDENGKLLKFALNYKFTRDIFAYFTAAEGYRPGGVNQTLGLPSYASTYESDSVWAYEVGLKTAFFDRKVVLNVDVFRMDWSNQQVSASFNNAYGFITNSTAPVQIQGVEFDTAFYPIERLSLKVSGSYIDAKLKADQTIAAGIAQCPVPFVTGTTGCATIAKGLKGDPVPNSPHWTLQTSADYATPLHGGDMQIIYHADLSYRGKSITTYNLPLYATNYPNGPFGTPGGAALYTLPAFATVGARIGIEKERGRWGVYLFANNLFNTLGLTSLTNGLASATTLPYSYNGTIAKPNSAVAIAPRLIGIEFQTKFR